MPLQLLPYYCLPLIIYPPFPFPSSLVLPHIIIIINEREQVRIFLKPDVHKLHSYYEGDELKKEYCCIQST